MASISLNIPELNREALKSCAALSAGLPIFTFLLYLIDLSTDGALRSKFSYYPNALLELDLNRLSFFLLFHVDFFHWLLNVISLAYILPDFERKHGTIYTGVTLNLLTSLTGIQYTIVGVIFGIDTPVVGLSGIVFSLVAYLAYNEHKINPVLHKFHISNIDIEIPTLVTPFLFFIVGFILTPSASHWGHLCAISTGFIFALGYLKVIFPPHNAIAFIEGKCTPLVNLIDKIVTFIKETDAVHTRTGEYVPLFTAPSEV